MCQCSCAMVKLLFLLIIMSSHGHGQITDYLFPNFAQTTRQITDSISKNPVVTLATKATGNVLATVVNAVTRVPLALTRTLRSLGIEIPQEIQFPSLLSNVNTVGVVDNIIADFNSGLGNEDARLSIGDMIRKYGYPMEQHEVKTTDGYILNLFRIPKNGSVVFLMHGLVGSADDYVISGPESGLAYLLADAGYDVWMGNARGNKHSRRHVDMSPSDAVFWDFSWHEIGFYDLPAMIDFVLKTTDSEALKYIGHSQGTTVFFVMASERPEYNKKISLMVALSPVAFMSNARSPMVRLLAPGTPIIHSITKSIGVYEFLPDDTLIRTFKLMMCGATPLSEILCGNLIFLITGFGFEQLNVTNLPVLFAHVPSGAAAKQFAHYGQGVTSGEFRKYDYGRTGNLEKYGVDIPPSYDLGKITAPVSLFYSDADWLAHRKDVDELHKKLGNAVDIHKVPFDPFNHVDFVWSKDFKELIFKRLQKLLKKF